jgi:pimeloyl-ACP methyl ester carboxylesterase
MVRRLFVVIGVLLAAVAVGSPAPVSSQAVGDGALRPILFVHGFMGSGQQFETQALRFTSNGYPAELIDVFEHDSLAYPGSQAQVWQGLDARIEALLASSGADQINLVGHSQGTGVSQGYLNSDPARAARVAAYVNLDGAAGEVPASVRALAVWGEGRADRTMPGATNVQFANQGHTQVVNSPETFAAMYQFLLGEAPTFAEVVREPADAIAISGRVVLFPENRGASAATLEVYEVDGSTGARQGGPVATVALSGDGAFGPLAVDGDHFYEFAVVRPGESVHHVYLQRFVRSSRWVRILTSEPDGLANSFWEPSATAQNLVVMRNEEWWGDQGSGSDRLAINGRDVLTPANSPRSNRTIGVFLHDGGVDGRTDLEADVAPSGLPFLIGIDLVIPAGDPAPGTTSVRAWPRNGSGPEAVCVPAYSSAAHRSSIQMHNFHRTLEPNGSPGAGHADPVCAAAPPAPPQPPAPPVTRPPTTGPTSPPPAPPATAQPGNPPYTG